jgi:CubicO group peptidase (beta-lactamase class C family)
MKNKLTRQSIHLAVLLGLLSSILAGCASSPTPAAPTQLPVLAPAAVDYWPTAGWRTSTPAEQGMDAQKLADMLDKIQQDQLNLDSLLVIRNGYLVLEKYFGSFQQDTRHELYSCTKSFISTLVGIALDQGLIAGTEQPILGFFPGKAFANPDPQKETMTLEDLLTMRSGLDWEEGDPTYRAMYVSQDWVKYVLDEPMAQPPGTQFLYCSGCTHVLSAIVQKATGMNTLDFAKRNLFEPLGITNLRWDTDSTGIPIGGWGLQITPRDMAKLGYLYLYGGEWDGQQIVSTAWVENATTRHTATDGTMGYGYQWWIYPSLEGYTALGRYGQTIFVIPWADLVIVTTAPNLDNHDKIFQLIDDYIVPAVQKP